MTSPCEKPSLLESWKNGSTVERLSIAAGIATLCGGSLVTIGSGVFLLDRIPPEVYNTITIIVFFTALFLFFLFCATIYLWNFGDPLSCEEKERNKKLYRSGWRVLLVILVVLIAPFVVVKATSLTAQLAAPFLRTDSNQQPEKTPASASTSQSATPSNSPEQSPTTK